MKIIISFIGNVIWKIFGGAWLAIFWFVLGALLTLSIIGFPLAVGCFKIGYVCWKPTNKRVGVYFGKFAILNVLWCLLFGFLILPYAIISISLNILSVFGLPLVKQWGKILKINLFPFECIIK